MVTICSVVAWDDSAQWVWHSGDGASERWIQSGYLKIALLLCVQGVSARDVFAISPHAGTPQQSVIAIRGARDGAALSIRSFYRWRLSPLRIALRHYCFKNAMGTLRVLSPCESAAVRS